MRLQLLVRMMKLKRFSKYLACGLIGLAVLFTACSEERKREAARLESELHGDTAAVASAVDSGASVDSSPRPAETQPADSSRTFAVVPDSTTASDSSRTEVAGAATEQSVDTSGGRALRDSEPVADVNAVPDENSSRRPEAGMPPQPHDGYTIQVGSSTSESYAQEMARTFLDRGYQAYVVSVTVDARTYYRVRVGFYQSTLEARGVLSELKDKYAVDGWIDPVTK